MGDDDFEISFTPPTEEELFEMFCYEMFLKHRDEKLHWEGEHVKITFNHYKNKNKGFLEQEYKKT